VIRDRHDDDHDRIRAINAANVPEVGPLDEDRLALFATSAAQFRVVEVDGLVRGLFVGLVEGLDYGSPNYRWFAARHPTFAYVDRIALEPDLRGRGLADELYQDFEDWARVSGRTIACAEVNLEPPNPRSLRFHQRRGYDVVAECQPYGPHERVAMVEKRL
jgi:predicted GNAT superfamily acetyltransferase